jgi:type VI secretion system lysozyme-like protein
MKKVYKGFKYLLKQEEDVLEPTESIKRNIEIILNSRSPLSLKDYLDSKRILTVLEFGVPDISKLSLKSEDDSLKIFQVLKKAIEAFEPRITELSMELLVDKKKGNIIFIKAVFFQTTFSINLIFKNALWKVEEHVASPEDTSTAKAS